MPRFRLNRSAAASLCAAALALLGVAAIVYAQHQRGKGKVEFSKIERGSAAEASKRPNIVFIYTDDQNASEFNRRYMPRTMRLLGDGGTTFSNFVVTTPICCPSRAAMLSGQYAHNNGVYTNKSGYAGLRDQANTLGGWLQHAGYRTAWFGKFLQQYKRVVKDPSTPAPGFDDWQITLKPKYFGWKLFANGETIKGGKAPSDYFTDELTRRASAFVEANAGGDRPLFMVVNNLAPHRGEGGEGRCSGTVAPAPADRKRFSKDALPKPPSFNRPAENQTAFPGKRLDSEAIAKEHDRHRCRAESLGAVDRGVEEIYNAVDRAGALDETIFVFTSDNGILQGQHGLTGKNIPYEEGLRMPLAIRVPPQLLDGSAPASIDRLTANIDLAPTLLDLVGARPCIAADHCRRLDGRSLVPLLESAEQRWPSDRAIVIEGGEHGEDCSFRGLRLESEVLLASVTPAEGGGCVAVAAPELYDLDADPFQIDNRVSSVPRRTAALQRRLERLEHCAGTKGALTSCE